MRRTEALRGVRMIKFRRIPERYEANEFNQIGATELLGITERTLRRWRRRFEVASRMPTKLGRWIAGSAEPPAFLGVNREQSEHSSPCATT